MAVHSLGSCHTLQLREKRTRPTHDEAHIRVRPDHGRERFDQMTLAGERVQALHVQEDVLFSQSERRARPPSADVVVKGERARDGWTDDLRVTTRQTELGRALQQAVAVERDRVRRAVRAREEIGTPPSRAIVPDLGAVERQHDRLAASSRQERGGFGQ